MSAPGAVSRVAVNEPTWPASMARHPTYCSPIEGFPGWQATAGFRSEDGVLLLESVTVEPSAVNAPPGEQVTVAMIRAVRLRDLQREVGVALNAWSSPASKGAASELRGRPGRAGRDDRPYAQLAARYLELCAESDRPVVDLAAERFQSVSTVRNLLTEAGRRELIERTRGRAGGRLTEKARRLLEQED